MTAPAWLQDLPSGWDRAQLWTQCKRFSLYGANIPSTEYVAEGVRFLRTTDISDRGELLQNDPVYVPPDAVGGYRVEDGDLLLSRSGTLGRSFLYDAERHGPCAYAGYLVRYKPANSLDGKYLFYFTKSRAFGAWLRANAIESTIGNISGQKFASLILPLPPRKIQESIVAFLDCETARIDTLIEKKRRLLDLLEEKRAAHITRAVTRGLDPDAPMKDSEVEWIGEIPEHWELVRLGRKIALQRGVDITKAEQREGGVPVISSGGVSSFHDTAYAKGPGVVIGRKGTLGTVHYTESDYWPHDTTLWVKTFRGNLPRFVYYKLQEMCLERLDTGSANPTLNRNIVHPMLVSWPNRAEQERIAETLDQQELLMRKSSDAIGQAIYLLREYRTSLISAAVTGQLDVPATGS